MSSRIALLGGLLIVQLLVVGWLNIAGETPQPDGVLLDMDAAAVTRLSVTDADGATITMVKQSAGWQLESGAAADEAKILAVLERLTAMRGLWPVASTSGSQSRFEVSEDAFQRRLVLTAEGRGDATVLLGSSPGYRRIHARNTSSEDIFSVEFATYEVPVDAGEWLDKTQLQASEINGLILRDAWTLTASGEDWLLDGVRVAAEDLVRRVAELRLIGSFDGDETSLGEPRELAVTAAGDDYTLTFRHDAEADEYVVSSSRVPGQFTVASYIAEQILVSTEMLLAETTDGGAEASEDASENFVELDESAGPEGEPADGALTPGVSQ
jgi:hypothetical protein